MYILEMISIDDKIIEASSLIKRSKYTIALTGAGISTESGIPDFRGPSGLWKRVDPEYATYTFFREHPDTFWVFFIDLYREFKDAKPNPAHHALAKLEEFGLLKCVITQNIDGLHQKAGSKNVIELHGSLRRVVCTVCGEKYDYDEVEDIIGKKGYPPICMKCGGILKPEVVLFGEALPYNAISKAYDEASKAELILVLGTSLFVYPAAYIPDIVKSHGGKVVMVNLEETEKDHIGDVIIYGKLGEILPKILRYI
jgi:NAD-dependent deacetylase